MTRPFGRPIARSKLRKSTEFPQPHSLIDVGSEDDNLLPSQYVSANKTASSSNTGTHSLASIQEDEPDCETAKSPELPEMELCSPVVPAKELTSRKKKKQSGFNLRKSLAWNNAFFTEEGVLDPEELSLVNRTFKKTPDMPKSNKKPAVAGKFSKPPTIPKINLSAAQSGDNRAGNGSVQRSSYGGAPNRNSSGQSAQHDTNHKGRFMASYLQADPIKQLKIPVVHGEVTTLKQLVTKKVVDSNSNFAEWRTTLTLPSLQPKEASSFSSTLSSMSRKMKDKLGMVLSGRSGASCSSKNIPLPRCYSHSSFERFGTREQAFPCLDLSANKESWGQKHVEREVSNKLNLDTASKGDWLSLKKGAHGVPSIPESHNVSSFGGSLAAPEKQAHVLPVAGCGTQPYGPKPSGLRMPSPKLGFFDVTKPTSAPHIEVLRERTNGLLHDGCSLQLGKNMLAGKLAADGPQTSSYKVASVKLSNQHHVPQKTSRCKDPYAEASHSSLPPLPPLHHPCEYESSREPQSLLRIPKCKKVQTVGGHFKGQAIQAKKEAQATPQLAKDNIEGSSGTSSHVCEDASSDQGKCSSKRSTQDECNTMLLTPVGTESVMKSLMIEEWPQEKSGQVQNSPPDKESPTHGPWSPVRRNGQQLGPFDCTKCTNPGLVLR